MADGFTVAPDDDVDDDVDYAIDTVDGYGVHTLEGSHSVPDRLASIRPQLPPPSRSGAHLLRLSPCSDDLPSPPSDTTSVPDVDAATWVDGSRTSTSRAPMSLSTTLFDNASSPPLELKYSCVLCPSSAPKMCTDRLAMRNHISEHHNYTYDVNCPYGDWEGAGTEELQQHFKCMHSTSPPLTTWELEAFTRVYGHVRACPICDNRCTELVNFFDCILGHCPVTNASFSGEFMTDDTGYAVPAELQVPLSVPELPTNIQHNKALDEYISNPNFAQGFACDVWKSSVPQHKDQETMREFEDILPGALDSFADKVAYDGGPRSKRFKLMIILHKAEIIRSIEGLCRTQNPANDPIQGFNQTLTSSGATGFDTDLLNTLSAFRWLIGRLRAVVHLTSPAGSAMQHIEDQIVQSHLPIQVRASGSSITHIVTIVIAWGLKDYFWRQVSTENKMGCQEQTVDYSITLTGSLDDAQAVTCAQYLSQTWPSYWGIVLETLKGIAESRKSKSFLDIVSDGLEVVGEKQSVIALAQQLAWVGAAFRSSPDESRLALCQPALTQIESDDTGSPRFRVDYNMKVQDESAPILNGRCWHGLFKSPAIATGFPIRRRTLKQSGLEAPLNILGQLVYSRWITELWGKVYIKGHSLVLVPTRVLDGMVFWHMVSSNDGSYLSYVDPRVDTIPGLYPGNIDCNLVHYRHVLGWCSEAITLTGSSGASYDLEWSHLTKADKGCVFARLHISCGTPIPDLEVPDTNRPDLIFSSELGDYLSKLQSISKCYVALYDVEEQRGWLVDGASALLHLVRASLRLTANQDLVGEFIFKEDKLTEAPANAQGRVAAIDVLKNSSNLHLKLYRNMKECFQDRVHTTHHRLEQALAHQRRAGIESCMTMDDHARQQRRLEGFDFMDMAGNEEPFWACATSIQEPTPQWVQFAQVINAVTLFGNGFVPCFKDYLAVRVEDLHAIMRKRGNWSVAPPRVVDDLYWHTPDIIFEDCQCTESSQIKCNRAQVLISKQELEAYQGKLVSPGGLRPNGAVIFDGSSQQMGGLAREASLMTPGSSQSPDRDSGIGPEPNRGFRIDKTEVGSQMKRPIDDRPQLHMPRKRLHRDSMNSSANESHARRALYSPNSARHPTATASPTDRSTNLTSPDSKDLPNNTYGQQFREDIYKVGWICALQVELNAAQRMLDKVHARGFGHGMDCNLYVLGQIGSYNDVLACLPRGQYGNNTAAVVATRMMSRFPHIEIGLMVGIGGGLPTMKNDIRLGDVVVSTPTSKYGGVVQYGMGKSTTHGFINTGSLKAPPEKLLQVLNFMPYHGTPLAYQSATLYPGAELDRLYQIARAQRDTDQPYVWYGTIASGNSVIKCSETRETLVQKYGVLCCEMEAAGLMNSRFPCLVIRGISDYADSHKNDIWVEYAAGTAARYARELLLAMPEDISLGA
ncbi:hypothetical protein BJY04DRAFT_225564 [Aspergillus karnatakaensis]|uniref:5'-methylthioadenosine/S-adenosylhomocysteine nucleosidase n=1 Tax=Aspergillus karnatakaensis TaxID=1810916 RepID=UPI003CCD2586